MKKIELLNSEQLFNVDDIDFQRVSRFNWWLGDKNKIYGGSDGKTAIGRFILNCKKDDPEVDHSDRDLFNNSRSNLRFATRSQQIANTRKRKSILLDATSSKYKGVFWCKTGKNWRVRIMKNGMQIEIGRFNNEENAGRAYDLKAIELFGEFACLNFPEITL